MKIHIAHVLYSFEVGGLENMLVNLINAMDCNRFSHSIYVFCNKVQALGKIKSGNASTIVVKRIFPNDPTIIFRLAHAIRKGKPDIVCTYNWSGIDGIIAAKSAGVKTIIHSEHGFNIGEIHRQKKRRILARRFLFKYCDKVITVSKTLERWLTEIVGIEDAKITYIPNACDTNKFFPGKELEKRKKWGIGEDDIVIGTVGSLKELKNQKTLIEAFTQISRTDLKLLIVGDGPERERLEDLTSSLGAKDKIIFTGIVSDTACFYRAMDIFVLPSLAENAPSALLEAMATGLPIIATDVGDVRYMLDDTKGGIIVRPKDARAITDGINCFLDRPSLAKEKSNFVRKRVKELFDLDRMIKTYEKLYLSYDL